MSKSLSQKKCVPCEGGAKPLELEQINKLLTEITEWELAEENNKIARYFRFKNFYETMAFVNAIAWIANSENHHPDLNIGYNYCQVHYHTHAIKGLSENDFICAAKINKLIES